VLTIISPRNVPTTTPTKTLQNFCRAATTQS
jgi:hypothetical protein